MSDLKTKSRLGRGLSSLISVSNPLEVDSPPAESSATVGAVVAEIAIDQIVPNPHQPRRTINEAAIADLASSLKSNGLIQPVVVRKVGSGFELIAGERRWRAARQAGFANIPAIVREVDRFKQAELALVENIQREDLNPIDRAAGYKTLIEQLGLTQAELAQRLGEDRSTIANHLRLLDLAEPVRELIRDEKIQLGHAKLLAGVSNLANQERLARLTAASDLSVRQLERLVQGHAAEAAETSSTATPHLRELEKSFTRQLGLRVQIRSSRKKGKGRLIVHYSTLDEFDRLATSLGVKAET
ncbi:MAG TPA: ParB/RepB/Spo0J family partition protein [Tepidisphaeraceae bacterium]|nr:ParB/RepB/Spo0J family partition protein [Tepidisphaeraceae bacterium]